MTIRLATVTLLLSSLALGTGCDSDSEDEDMPLILNGDDAADDAADDEGDDEGETEGDDEGETEGDDEGETEGEEVEDDSCGRRYDARSCDGGNGQQFCDDFDGSLEWGPCIDSSDIWCTPGTSEACEVPELDIYGETRCDLYNGEITHYSDCDTPLVLELPEAPVTFEPAGSATFDITVTNGCINHDWPSSDTPWLAIDLDKNGSIDSGRELFGSGTRLQSGARAQDGFSALAELDTDGDGAITPADDQFDQLVLWSDHDHDRRSTLWELTPLAARGVLSIALDYVDDPRCDARGNCSRERASAELVVDGRPVAASVVDVHLSCQ